MSSKINNYFTRFINFLDEGHDPLGQQKMSSPAHWGKWAAYSLIAVATLTLAQRAATYLISHKHVRPLYSDDSSITTKTDAAGRLIVHENPLLQPNWKIIKNTKALLPFDLLPKQEKALIELLKDNRARVLYQDLLKSISESRKEALAEFKNNQYVCYEDFPNLGGLWSELVQITAEQSEDVNSINGVLQLLMERVFLINSQMHTDSVMSLFYDEFSKDIPAGGLSRYFDARDEQGYINRTEGFLKYKPSWENVEYKTYEDGTQAMIGAERVLSFKTLNTNKITTIRVPFSLESIETSADRKLTDTERHTIFENLITANSDFYACGLRSRLDKSELTELFQIQKEVFENIERGSSQEDVNEGIKPKLQELLQKKMSEAQIKTMADKMCDIKSNLFGNGKKLGFDDETIKLFIKTVSEFEHQIMFKMSRVIVSFENDA